jgi:hypothetical protein
MRPITPWTWRKTLRMEAKGIYRRHYTRTVETEQPRKGSTWGRRHRQALPRVEEKET